MECKCNSFSQIRVMFDSRITVTTVADQGPGWWELSIDLGS